MKPQFNINKEAGGIIRRFFQKVIDIRMGMAGAVVMGLIVFFVNYYKTGWVWGSSTAAMKQAAFTFIFGGIFMKGCENL
ncbi:MAG: hypothetical protein KKA81_00535, partial [Bacteroidetes bacterium]|nr:hypothetical protein [Bacteroidota bacterium]